METKRERDGNQWMRYAEALFFLLLLCVFAYIIIKDLTMVPDSSMQTNPYMEYSGEHLKERGMELIVIFSSLALSVICIILSVALRIYYRKKIALEYLGWGIFIAALWNVANSIFWPLIFRNASVVSELGNFMLMLLPIPFVFYVNEIQNGRYRKAYSVASVLLLVVFCLRTLLHITGLYDLSNMAFLNVFCTILSSLLILFTMICDIRTGDIRKYPFMAVGLAGIFLACLFRILGYFYRNGKFDAVILPIGLIILLLIAILNTIHEITNMEGAKQQALAASEAKGKFLANMSHEIRTPINAVLGMDAMILRECAEPHIREYALDIQNAGQSLLSLINDILDLSKIESGKLEILPGEYDFSSLIHDIMNMIRMKAEDKGLSVELFIDEKLPSRLFGDDVRIRQILVNLMNNAVKYTEEGTVTLTVSGTVSSQDVAEGVLSADAAGVANSGIALTFQVEDTGIGMKEEDIPKLFAEFERIEEKRNRNIEGTGLGMSITTQLLEMMGSKLEVKSVYGEGSKFFFTLEQGIVSKEPIGNLEERIRKQAADYTWQVTFTAPEAQVLLVDDNAMNRKVFTSLLKETKVQIDEAAGGLECLDMVQKKHYDMVFLDHMMPDLDGIETLHRMKALQEYPCKSTPVVALTANAVSGAKEMYLAEGFFSFLSKPVNPDKLEKMLMENLPEDKLIKSKVPEEVSAGKPQENHSAMGQKDNSTMTQKGGSNVEELPEVDGIDWEYALLHTKDMELLTDTVKVFAQMMEGEAAALEKLYQVVAALSEGKQYIAGIEKEQATGEVSDERANQTTENVSDGSGTQDAETAEALKQYRVKVHSMKSSAAMIGAVPLSGIAKLLEYAARDGKVERIRKVTPTFLEEWREMKERLKPVAAELAGDSGAEKPEVDFGVLKQKLDLLDSAMEDMDIDAADAISEELNGFHYPEKFLPLIENLTLAVANIDAEQAAQEIAKLQAQMEEM